MAREHDEVIARGGLHILGTERHEARRIDNQLRGRSGRQGDPGSSRFYISLEDDLMKILGSDRIRGMLVRAGMNNGVPLENRLVSRAIENAQKQIEGQNFSIRKHLLEYDDVMNKQRQHIYALRRDILFGKDFKEYIQELIDDLYEEIFSFYIDENKESEHWDIEAFQKEILLQFGLDLRQVIRDDCRDTAAAAAEREGPRAASSIIYAGKGNAGRLRADARTGTDDHAAGHRFPVEGPSAQRRPSERRHRPARLCPERPADRI